MSVILVHPAKAVGRNEMPFDRNTRVHGPNKQCINRQVPRSPQGEKEIWELEPPVRNDAA